MRFSPDRSLGLVPATVRDYRERARRRLPRQLFDYIDGGSYQELTLKNNVRDLEEILLRQVVMRDVSVREQTVEVLGQKLDFPVILGPVGLGGMYARRAETQAARAAEKAGTRFVESTVSICSIEEVAEATSTPPWFQMYVMRDRSFTERLMARAAAVNSPVLMLTVDLPVVGERHRDTQNAMVGNPPLGAKLRRAADLISHPRWVLDVGIKGKPHGFGNLAEAVPGASSPAEFKDWVDAQFDPSVTWDDIAWVREHWKGKLVLKGILDPEDARKAVDSGVDGIVVSNHGGRQLDSVPSVAKVLPAVAEAVDGRTEVLADGGVRDGLDVVKLMAMGAGAVLVGRAWAWAAAADGESGVTKMLSGLKTDIDTALGLIGYRSVNDLDTNALYGA